MAGAARLNDMCTGHAPCYPPRTNVEASTDTYYNGRGGHRQGDAWSVHCCIFDCHPSNLAQGSPTVYTNGRNQGRINDPVACGSNVMTGSDTVMVGP